MCLPRCAEKSKALEFNNEFSLRLALLPILPSVLFSHPLILARFCAHSRLCVGAHDSSAHACRYSDGEKERKKERKEKAKVKGRSSYGEQSARVR